MVEAGARYRGVVKWFNPSKGYGFIRWAESERDVFVHYTAIERPGHRNLVPGDEVEFGVEENQKGWRAINVVVVEPANML